MEDVRVKEEIIGMMGTLIQRFDGLEADVKQLRSVQSEHYQILKEHFQILTRVDVKTNTIAEKVLEDETRITKSEQGIQILQGNVY